MKNIYNLTLSTESLNYILFYYLFHNLFQGGQLKDDADLKKFNLKPGHAFMMLGTAGDTTPKEPIAKPKFIEDMSDFQIAQETKYPTGLINMGNTCYLNSTLQALRSIPELRKSLEKYTNPSPADITVNLKRLYTHMDNGISIPSNFIAALRNRFPQFAEQDDHGHFRQQDAEEVYSILINTLRGSLTDSTPGNASSSNVIDEYFSGSFDTELQSIETPEDPVKRDAEQFFKLDCHISINTNYLKDGILDSLTEKIEKHNESLGRDAEYKLTKRISRLPEYLTVHYVRFFWRRDTQKKSKILRKVIFPKELDVTDLCSDELKAKIVPVREKLQEIRKEEEETRRAAKKLRLNPASHVGGSSNSGSSNNKSDPVSEEKKKEYRESLKQVIDPSLKADKGSNPSGLYELQAVVTHQGASADSGHYQAFVKNDLEEGKWWRFNDDKVTLVEESKIDTLSGGGEADSALILIYRTADV